MLMLCRVAHGRRGVDVVRTKCGETWTDLQRVAVHGCHYLDQSYLDLEFYSQFSGDIDTLGTYVIS